VQKSDDPLPLDWREKTIAHIAQLNASHRGRLRSEVVQREQQILEEMREVQAVRKAMKTCGPPRYIPPEQDLAKIVKYETMLERNIKRKMDMLQKLQADRAKRKPYGRRLLRPKSFLCVVPSAGVCCPPARPPSVTDHWLLVTVYCPPATSVRRAPMNEGAVAIAPPKSVAEIKAKFPHKW
jgi:hypothetical protein